MTKGTMARIQAFFAESMLAGLTPEERQELGPEEEEFIKKLSQIGAESLAGDVTATGKRKRKPTK